jgi:aerobic carbon-monoxide dehydrogenase large subunit
MATNENEFGIGKPVRRKEDARLLTGRGRYTVDIDIPGQARAVLLRSPHAHARIKAIDTRSALAVPGVLAVYTGADVVAAGMKRVQTDQEGFGPRHVQLNFPDVVLWNRDGSDIYPSPLLPLATERARFVGHAVAMVVAETFELAQDAADAVEVDYEVLPAVTYSEDAARVDAPLLWDEKSNVCLDAEAGNAAATEAAFARAAHVARLKTWCQRVTGVTMEPRAAVAAYDAARDHVTLYAGAGAGAVRTKAGIDMILGWPPDRLRVVAYDIGGNFGTRNAIYPESTLLAWAARNLNRAIKWVAERQESFAADFQGRDLVADAELALDRGGKFLAMRSKHLSNLGTHMLAIIPLRKAVGILSGVYDIETGYVEARGVLSNTPTTVPYRSAGRPEAMFILERLIDIAAREYGFDRIELRRRNLIAPQGLPYTNCTGVTYDSGEYERVMDEALALADVKNFAARRHESARQAVGPRHRQLHREHHRHSARARRSYRAARGPCRYHHRHPIPWPRSRDQLRAMHQRLAGRRFQCGPSHHRRHRHRAGRRGQQFRALNALWQRADGLRRRRDRRQWQAHHRAFTRSLARGHRFPRRRFRDRRHRPSARPL